MRKIIIYLSISLLIVIFLIILIYFYVRESTKPSNNLLDEEEIKEEEQENIQSVSSGPSSDNISYVSCDDSTVLLNVRKEPSGSIIDGLSCYKEISILDEIPGDSTCPKWYQVKYSKISGNYTGYVCSDYIKTSPYSKEEITKVQELISKALTYYSETAILPYCGETIGTKEVIIDKEKYEYLKSKYKSLSALTSYLYTFLDKSLIPSSMKLSDANNLKYGDDYFEIDGNLYCRGYSNKEEKRTFTGNYNIELANITSSTKEVNISYEYLSPNSTCTLNSLKTCQNKDFLYDLKKIQISTQNSMDIITSINPPNK